MSTLQELNDKLDTVAAGINALESAISDLKSQLAEGNPVTQEQLDALNTKVATIIEDLLDTSDQS